MTDGDRPDHDRRGSDRMPLVLRVDYEDADDLLADYTENLSSGGTCVANGRLLAEGTEVQLVLSFPGLVAPIPVDGVVRWTRVGDEPMIGIEFKPGVAQERLAAMIDRIRDRDPKVVKRTLRVLIVEDNPHVAQLISHGLGGGVRGLGADLAVSTKTARDGREALAMIGETTFDALIVDVYLPVIDGASMIATVRGQLGMTELPIIAVSAGGETARRAAMSAGADIFIDKPMRLRNVIETIRSLMSLG
jgi:uncharacterized protein (TIGR02266 family)